MKIYTVYEDGVGYGVIGIASYYSEKEAKDHASRSSYYYILETVMADGLKSFCKTCYYKTSCQEDYWNDDDFVVSGCDIYEKE